MFLAESITEFSTASPSVPVRAFGGKKRQTFWLSPFTPTLPYLYSPASSPAQLHPVPSTSSQPEEAPKFTNSELYRVAHSAVLWQVEP